MSVIIKDIQKNSTEIIRIEVSEFKGRELINIRIWYLSQDSGSGSMIYKPTQKGIALSLAEYAELRDGIEKLGNYIADKESGTAPDQFIDKADTIEEKTADD